ncbi:uncharacterized protein LOC126986926 [Eriocheir sinensis]|uniref:uncharacterized protein LOC126986926 n=1 Tax=Eriocheir sinensis TaxID=95602 RepID=UPI0021C60278|nr:uncharacterized protein LOC126986926 [Eriocheir sinensis]
MEYSGPASISAVEADLALSDDEDITDQHWPPIDLNTQCFGPTPWQPQVDVPPSATQPSTSTKRPMDQTSNTSDSSSPAPKSSRHIEPPHPTAPISSPSSYDPHNSSRTHDSRTCPHSTPSQPTSADGASTSKQPSLSTADTSVNQESTCGMAVRAAPPLPSQLSTRCLPLFTPPVKHHHHGRGPAPPPILQPLPRLSRHKLPLFVKLSQS